MKFLCKATINTEGYREKLDAYHKEVDEYNVHLDKMEDDELYKLSFGEQIIEPPTPPETTTGYVPVHLRDDVIVGYEDSGKKTILLIINFAMTGQGSYIIKRDDKVIEELDNLLNKNL